jgi:hypothetical protein
MQLRDALDTSPPNANTKQNYYTTKICASASNGQSSLSNVIFI